MLYISVLVRNSTRRLQNSFWFLQQNTKATKNQKLGNAKTSWLQTLKRFRILRVPLYLAWNVKKRTKHVRGHKTQSSFIRHQFICFSPPNSNVFFLFRQELTRREKAFCASFHLEHIFTAPCQDLDKRMKKFTAA